MAQGMGRYPHFNQWGHRRPWGPEERFAATFGPAVMDDLVAGLDEFDLSTTAAIGCVYWLTHKVIADRLARMSGVCVVIDKKSIEPTSRRLNSVGADFPIEALSGLKGMVTESNGNTVGPVRIAGFSASTQARPPLLHAKLLVIGSLIEHSYEAEGVGEWTEWRFEPERAWLGSANWTQASKNHLELGLWVDDHALIAQATSFVTDLIRFSEPIRSAAELPTPELADYEPDPDMWEPKEESEE